MRRVLGAAAVAVGVLMGAAGTAGAGVIVVPGSAFTGLAGGPETGTDAWGETWQWSATTGVGGQLPGLAAWGVPGLGAGEVTYQGSEPATGFEIAFVDPIAQIDQAPSPSAGGYNEFTRFDVCDPTCVEWTPHFITPDEVTFSAPTGTSLIDGEDFFVNVIFNEPETGVSSTDTGFSAAFTATVPEPATWAMMLLGVGMIGAGLRVARRKDGMASAPA
jgi:PEP-CTERM motif